MHGRRGWLAALATFSAVTGAGTASGAPRTRSVIVRGSTAHKLPGAADRSYYTAKHEQTVTFELEGPSVLVIDVQPFRDTEPSSGARFAATLDGKDLAWVDVSCKPTSIRLAPDPSPKEACAAVERRFEVGKGKHRLALRLVVGEGAALIPRVEAVIAKSADDLDLAPIVSNAPPAGAPDPSPRAEPSKPTATASASPKTGADLDLAPIAGAAPTRGTASPATAGTPAAAPPAATPAAAAPAPATKVAAQQPSPPPPARPPEPSTAAKAPPGSSSVAATTASPSGRAVVEATPATQGPRPQVAARSDLALSPKAPGAQFSFGFLTRPVVWGPAAVGAVSLGVAGYFGLQSRSSFSSAGSATQIGSRNLNDQGVTQAKTANVLYGVGGVALGAAAVMAVLEFLSGPSDAQGGL